MKRIVVEIQEELYEKMRVQVFQDNITIKEFVTTLLKKAVKHVEVNHKEK